MAMSAKIILLILVDFLIFLLISLLSGLTFSKGEFHIPAHEMLKIFSILSPILLLMFYIEGLYSFKSYDPTNVSLSIFRATCFSIFLSSSLLRLLNPNFNSFNFVPILVIGLVAPYMINLARKLFFELISSDYMLQNAVLVGSQDSTMPIYAETINRPFIGYRVKNIITPEYMRSTSIPKDIELVAIEKKYLNEFKTYLDPGLEVIDLAIFSERLTGRISHHLVNEDWFIENCTLHTASLYSLTKRFVDLSVAFFLLMVFGPLFLLFLPFLLTFHGRPIFFSQARTGANMKTFTLFKLRTMIVNAEQEGAMWSRPGDKRITPLGKWLRKTRIDELPQLWNIIKGEMSLVGPRPERPEIIHSHLETSIPHYNLRHFAKPGVTGWAQISFRYGYSKEDSLEKFQYDLFYLKNRSLLFDFLILLKTVKTVLTGAGQ